MLLVARAVYCRRPQHRARKLRIAQHNLLDQDLLVLVGGVSCRFSYTALLERHDLGRYAYQVLYASPELQAELLAYQRPRVRIVGEVEGIAVSLVWQPSGDGRLYLLIGDELRRARKPAARRPRDRAVRHRRPGTRRCPPSARAASGRRSVLRAPLEHDYPWPQACAGTARRECQEQQHTGTSAPGGARPP
jgi:hypothetical protein